MTPTKTTKVDGSKCVALLLASLLATSCAPTYQVARPDQATGMLPTNVEAKDEEIRVFTPSARISSAKFFLVRAEAGNAGAMPFGKFILDSLPGLGVTPVVSRDELVRMILGSELRDSVGNVTDPIALAKISDVIGPFLIVDAVQVFQGHAWFETRLRVTDPSSATTLLDVHRLRLNWSNLDKEVNFPVLNVLKRWVDESRALPPAAEHDTPRPAEA